MADENVGAEIPSIPTGHEAGNTRTCPGCGESVSNTATVCPQCGRSLVAGNSMAVASFLLSLLSFPAFFAALSISNNLSVTYGQALGNGGLILVSTLIFFSIPAIIFGNFSLEKIRKSPVPTKGYDLAKAGQSLGCLYVVFSITAMFWLASAAHPRMDNNEMAAIGNIVKIRYAQDTYKKAHGVYARSFAELIAEVSTRASLAGDWHEGVQKEGYIFSLTDEGGDGSSYEIRANPVMLGRTGREYFFSDPSFVIRGRTDGPADSTSPSISKLGDFIR